MKPFTLPLRVAFGVILLSFLASCTKDIQFNKQPVVDAGADQSVKLSEGPFHLSGTASDPDGSVVAYLWSQLSGPSSASIVNPGSPSTEVKSLVPGYYVFQLMATDDDGATSVDTTSLNVQKGEVTLSLQPTNNPNEIKLTSNLEDGRGIIDMVAMAWTKNGFTYNVRSLFSFDLSSIPANATVKSATLYLYSYPPPTYNGNLQDANAGTNNSLYLSQVLEPWDRNTVNWNNQPATSNSSRLSIPHTDQKMLDLQLNVKSMISDMISTQKNYGFLLRIQEENIYNSRIFVSSANTDYKDKHPKLVVVYE